MHLSCHYDYWLIVSFACAAPNPAQRREVKPVWRGVFMARPEKLTQNNKQPHRRLRMEELAPTSVVGGSFASCGMSLSDLAIGLDVTITSRTWAGINKPGGHAKITAIDASTDRIDVKYVLGGREKNLELMYVRPYVELERGSRGRKRDVKMNVDTLGGCGGSAQKKKKKRRGGSNSDDEEKSASSKRGKRTALSFIDGNGGQQHGTTIATTEAAAKVDNESWTLIKVSYFLSICFYISPCCAI